MKIKISQEFGKKLKKQVAYIAMDKPIAARKFKDDILNQIKSISKMPYKNRQSIYFSDESIREFIFKGYKVVYRIKPKEEIIEVFGFIKFEESL